MATLIAAILFAVFLVYLCTSCLRREKSRNLFTQLAVVMAVLVAGVLR